MPQKKKEQPGRPTTVFVDNSIIVDIDTGKQEVECHAVLCRKTKGAFWAVAKFEKQVMTTDEFNRKIDE